MRLGLEFGLVLGLGLGLGLGIGLECSLSSRYERIEPSLSADQLPIVSAELAELRTWLRVGLGIGVGLELGVGRGYTVQGEGAGWPSDAPTRRASRRWFSPLRWLPPLRHAARSKRIG